LPSIASGNAEAPASNAWSMAMPSDRASACTDAPWSMALRKGAARD
jgi:hypothetical protein